MVYHRVALGVEFNDIDQQFVHRIDPHEDEHAIQGKEHVGLAFGRLELHSLQLASLTHYLGDNAAVYEMNLRVEEAVLLYALGGTQLVTSMDHVDPGCELREEQSLSLIHISEPTRRTPISYAV